MLWPVINEPKVVLFLGVSMSGGRCRIEANHCRSTGQWVWGIVLLCYFVLGPVRDAHAAADQVDRLIAALKDADDVTTAISKSSPRFQ
jgi:hypothetical protein